MSIERAEQLNKPLIFCGSYSYPTLEITTEREYATEVANTVWRTTKYGTEARGPRCCHRVQRPVHRPPSPPDVHPKNKGRYVTDQEGAKAREISPLSYDHGTSYLFGCIFRVDVRADQASKARHANLIIRTHSKLFLVFLFIFIKHSPRCHIFQVIFSKISHFFVCTLALLSTRSSCISLSNIIFL